MGTTSSQTQQAPQVDAEVEKLAEIVRDFYPADEDDESVAFAQHLIEHGVTVGGSSPGEAEAAIQRLRDGLARGTSSCIDVADVEYLLGLDDTEEAR